MGALDQVWQELEKEAAELVEQYKDEIAKLRVGSVDVGAVKEITVEAYGTPMPLYQVATVMSQGATSVVITPWDKKLLEPIAEALAGHFKDITPTIKGESVYLNFPPLTEEKRKEFLKVIARIAETYRQRLRDVRNEIKRKLENMKKEGQLPEGDFYKAIEKLDAKTREYREQIEKVYEAKEKQIISG